MTSLLFAVHLVVFLSVGYVLYQREKEFRSLAIGSLLFKLGMGLMLGLLYKHYYTVGDTFNYFYDGIAISRLAKTDVAGYFQFLATSNAVNIDVVLAEPRALLMSKIVSVFCLLTGDNYWLISLYFSLISFLGCWSFVVAVRWHMPKLFYPAVISFLLFPSFIFWSSGVIKESLAVGSLVFLAGLFLHLWFRKFPGIFSAVLLIPAFWLCWSLKYYFAAAFLVAASAGLVLKLLKHRLQKHSVFVQVLVTIAVIGVPLILVSFVHPNFYYQKIWTVITDNYAQFHTVSEPGDAMIFWHMTEANPQILLNLPWAIVSGLFRPFVWEAHGALQIYASIENAILFLVTIYSLYKFRKSQIKIDPVLLIIVLAFVLALCIFLTLSTPNFGTLSRYRSAFLPFYAMVMLSAEPARIFLERSIARLVR